MASQVDWGDMSGWAAASLGVGGTAAAGYAAYRAQEAIKRDGQERDRSIDALIAQVNEARKESISELSAVSSGEVEPKADPAIENERRLLDSMDERARTRFVTQMEYYRGATRQSAAYFYCMVSVGLAGFLFILTGIALAMAGVVEAGVLTGLFGFITGGAAGLVFRQGEKANAIAQENAKAIAKTNAHDDAIKAALVFSSRIRDPELSDRINASLAQQLIFGSKAAEPNEIVKELQAGLSDDPNIAFGETRGIAGGFGGG